MGHNSHIDEELSDRLQALIETDLLQKDTSAYGIALLVIDGGLDTLSEKQRHVYDKFVEPLLYKI